ncbi:hypothetical protein C2E23DRAFT_852702 [Lenzites betulinus]|nr:hypothetical protein C2E23DRAFT_852702 [Lenzites betulinus]
MMRRFLAFANRGRASGSGLPAVLAQLNRVVDDADEGDAETAELFVSGVAGIIRQEKHIQAAVAEILQDDSLVVDIAAAQAVALQTRTPSPRSPEEQFAFEAWLARFAAFKDLGVTRLDGDTQGLSPALLQEQGKKHSRPLRRKLLNYLCELEVYTECAGRGIKYPLPCTLRISPDVKQASRVYLAESGSFLGGKSVPVQA